MGKNRKIFKVRVVIILAEFRLLTESWQVQIKSNKDNKNNYIYGIVDSLGLNF